MKDGQGLAAVKFTEEYSKDAKLVEIVWERAVYLSAGDKHTPAWRRICLRRVPLTCIWIYAVPFEALFLD